jgi:hypothetical protein
MRARANFAAVEILCISCAAFAVCFAIFSLPRRATFVDNRSSSAPQREAFCNTPATFAGPAQKTGEELDQDPRPKISKMEWLAAVAVFPQYFHTLWKYCVFSLRGSENS